MRRIPTPGRVATLIQRGRQAEPLWAGYLADTGWLRGGLPQDRHGQPIPWFTYPAIELLAGRVRGGMRVFEYGSGQSTLWWARRVASVVSVEHDAEWFAALRVPGNVELLHVEVDDPAYPSTVAGHGAFDVVVIDGRNRVACAPHALGALTPGGVIVWDNSERPEYEPGLRLLQDAGLRRVDLSGMGPVNPYGWSTSILYRDGNCLGL